MKTGHSERPRGLTLLETLIATAIMAMIAAACVPTIARAMTLLRHLPEPAVHIADLSIVADAFMADPSAFGFAQEELAEMTRFQFTWPTGDAFPASSEANSQVLVRVLRTVDDDIRDVWVVFECEGTIVSRWLALPENEDNHEERRQ